MSDFFDKDYELPTSNNGYMSFEQGKNKFRILSKPIVGWEWWVKDEDGNDKPRRCGQRDKVPVGELVRDGDPRHFWSMVVWNYQLEMVQILSIRQATIQKPIKN